MKELSLNILDIAQNSVKAGAKNIDIRLTETADTLTIEITDDGCGMDAEAVKGVIDPFFTTKDTGTGLGLPIALRTIKAHHGIIEAESIEGEMTKFTIMLPAVIEEEDD